MKPTIWKPLKWVVLWIALAAAFGAGVWYFTSAARALEFAGGYLIELSLSVDNLFVFITIFSGFSLNEHARHRVLHYGVIGAIVLRFLFIFFGIQLVTMFQWVLYVFGGLLIFSGIRMFREPGGNEKDPHDSAVIRLMSRVLPMTTFFDGERFVTRRKGRQEARIKLFFTPLFGVLCLIEFSDILFAIDSVPAVFSVTTDLLIVYSSNMFAILGLRQLYFVLEHLHDRFCYVKYGVAVVLVFTGLKLLGLMFDIHLSTLLSIAIIVGVIAFSMILSMIVTGRQARRH